MRKFVQSFYVQLFERSSILKPYTAWNWTPIDWIAVIKQHSAQYGFNEFSLFDVPLDYNLLIMVVC